MTTPAAPAAPPYKRRVFLFGTDMNPTTVLACWSDGRFIAIARADGTLTRGLGLEANAFGRDVWGIIVETGIEQRGAAVPLTLRDGSPSTAMLVGEASDVGAPEDILSEAYYWELPRAYRDIIKRYIDRTAGN